MSARPATRSADEERRAEAGAALDRVRRESEVIGTSRLAASVDGTRRHFGAADQDPADPVEVWGTRIGRLAGLAAFIGLAVYLLFTYVLR